MSKIDNLALEDLSDEDLICKLKAGRSEVYRELVGRYQNLVFTMIMRHVMQHSIAEELSQEVFIKAYSNINKFRGQARFSTWLIRIALNHVSSFYSSKAGKQRLATIGIDKAFSMANEESPDVLYDRKESLKYCRKAFLELKPKLQHVFSLCIFESQPYEEVAEILSIPIGTVRSRLNKARSELQKKLIAIYGEKYEGE